MPATEWKCSFPMGRGCMSESNRKTVEAAMKKRTLEMTPGDLVAAEDLDWKKKQRAEAERRFGVTDATIREATKPLFLLMFRHGIKQFTIERDGTKAKVLFQFAN
jgi:hypothetical protein